VSGRSLLSMVSDAVEDWQAEVARDVIGRGAEGVRRGRGGRQRIPIGAEGSAAGGVRRKDGPTSRHVEIFVELGNS